MFPTVHVGFIVFLACLRHSWRDANDEGIFRLRAQRLSDIEAVRDEHVAGLADLLVVQPDGGKGIQPVKDELNRIGVLYLRREMAHIPPFK